MVFVPGSFEDFLDIKSIFNEIKTQFLDTFQNSEKQFSQHNLLELRIYSRRMLAFFSFVPSRYLKDSLEKYESLFEKILKKSGKLRDIEIVMKLSEEFSLPESFLLLQKEVKHMEEKKYIAFQHSIKTKKLKKKEFSNLMVSKEFLFIERIKDLKNFIKEAKSDNLHDKEAIHSISIKIKNFKCQFEYLSPYKENNKSTIEELAILQELSGTIYNLQLLRKEINNFSKTNQIDFEKTLKEILKEENESILKFKKELLTLFSLIK